MDRHSTPAQPPRGAVAVAVRGASAKHRMEHTPGAPYARIGGATVARVLLATLASMLFWAAAPAAAGWSVTTVMTGSMEPVIHPGDVVVARPVSAAELTVGQVLLVDDPDHAGRLRLHRLASATPDGMLVLRGDANQSDDSSPVPVSAVHGVGFIMVPLVGTPVLWAAEGLRTNLVVLVAGLVLLLGMMRLDRGLDRQTGQTPAAQSAPTRDHRRLRAGATVTLVVGLAVAAVFGFRAVQTSAWAAFAGNNTNGSNSLAAATTYPCLAGTALDSPYLQYRFTEVSGTVTDSSTNARNGTLNGGATRVSGSCAQNDSPALALTSGFVSTPTSVSAAPTTMSMEIWVKTATKGGTGGRLMGFGSSQTGTSSSPDRQLYLTDAGKIVAGVFRTTGSPVAITSTAAVNDGAWHHVVMTFASTTMSLYVDKTLVGTSAVTSARTGSGYWRVGADAIPTGWPTPPATTSFSGEVDNATVYTTALSSTQVTSHYAAGR